MAELSSFTARGGRSWRDPPPPPPAAVVEEEEHRLALTGIGSETTTVAAASGAGDEPYPPSVAVYLLPPSPAGRRRPSFRAPAPFAPAAAARFFCDPQAEEEGRHFLDACTLCRKPLGANRDIFMYRGDVPFCSEECRQEQIDKDEARERAAMKASGRKASSSSSEQQQQQGIRVPAAGAIVAG